MFSRNLLTAVAVVVAITSTTACTSRLAVTAREGEAFIVRAAMFKSFVYRCEATDNQPVCTRVQEVR